MEDTRSNRCTDHVVGLPANAKHRRTWKSGTHNCQPDMAKMTELFHRSLWVSTTWQRGLNNIIFMLSRIHQLTACFILLQYPSQHGSFYYNIHHNMLHFTARYTTTWFILLHYHNLLQFTTIPITACFILLQHASFYCNVNHNMLQFTATCFISLE